MRFVRQIHKSGCGIATMSMLTGIGYKRMAKLLDPSRKSGERYSGTYILAVLRVLEKLKYKHRISFRKVDFSTLRNNAYVSVNTRSGTKHAVVWDAENQKILDPERRCTYITKEYARKHMNFVLEIWRD